MIYDLVRDFADVMEAMPETHPRCHMFALLNEAIRSDVHFIERHLTILFQCLWNKAWWHSSPEAAQHYHAAGIPFEFCCWPRDKPQWEPGIALHDVLERWRIRKAHMQPGSIWLRSLRPPPSHLGTGQSQVFAGHKERIYGMACAPDGKRLVTADLEGTIWSWDCATGAQLSSYFEPDGLAFCAAWLVYLRWHGMSTPHS